MSFFASFAQAKVSQVPHPVQGGLSPPAYRIASGS
jgi:hypothetical protein